MGAIYLSAQPAHTAEPLKGLDLVEDRLARSKPFQGSFDRLAAHVLEHRGIDLKCYRRPYLDRRLAARIRALELRSLRQYADYLEHHPEEYELMLDTLTINVTGFFRDKVVWDSMRRNIFTPLIHSKRSGSSRTIRLWSAGCATGEEPYSLAMTLLDMLGPDAKRFMVSVTATDLDPVALAKAKAGVYDKSRLKNIPSSYQVRFTREVSDSTFEVLPEVRRIVRFRRADLITGPPVKLVDLLVCRNIFIYFNREQQADILDTFLGSLSKDGYLVLGRSEKLSAQAVTRLLPIDGRERIYRKLG